MKTPPTFGDIVASAGLAATAGGFVFASGLVAILWGRGGIFVSPLEAIGTLFAAGMIGLIVGIFTAWPIGIVVGSLVSRWLGWTDWHAGIAGALTAIVMLLLANSGGSLTGLLKSAALATLFGAVTGLLSYKYTMYRAAMVTANS